MRRAIISAVAAVVLSAMTAWAQERPAPSDAKGEQPGSGGIPSADDKIAPKTDGDKTAGDAWRFRQHQGVWWYWLPSDKWVYWTGDRWVPYEQKSYAEFYASRHPRSSSSSNSNSSGGQQGYNSQGNWGPVRYNQWGQRQWPYSQRSSGLQQLGPVPAMGGVRSLPGWGGER